MSKRSRCNHTPTFKAKVALTVLKGDLTMAERSDYFSVYANQIQKWKATSVEYKGLDEKVLQAKIGDHGARVELEALVFKVNRKSV